MASVKEIRTALAALLEAGLGSELTVTAYMTANPVPPCADLFPTPVEYDAAFGRGSDDWTFTVRVFVDAADDVSSQETLDEFLAPAGPKSVKAALEADPTLGGLLPDGSDSIRVVRAEGYRTYETAQHVLLLGCSWIVELNLPGEEV